MRILYVVVVLFALSLTSVVQADTVTISKSIPYAEDSGVSDAVRDECKIETRLPAYLKKAAKKGVKIVLSKDPLDAAEGKALILTITNVYGLGGGIYSGSKSAVVSGELKENGEVIASMSARRHSVMGMMPGTCSIFKRISKKLGQDIAAWLGNPTMDAKLGDLADDE
jgi:hypothetical protein